MTGLSRRGVLGGATALVPTMGAAALAAPAHPDAELIAMGQEAIPLVRSYEASTAAFFAAVPGSPEMRYYADQGDAPANRLDQMFYRALELPATTIEGVRAKARVLQHQLRLFNRREGGLEFDSPDAELAWSLVCDLLRVTGGQA